MCALLHPLVGGRGVGDRASRNSMGSSTAVWNHTGFPGCASESVCLGCRSSAWFRVALVFAAEGGIKNTCMNASQIPSA